MMSSLLVLLFALASPLFHLGTCFKISALGVSEVEDIVVGGSSVVTQFLDVNEAILANKPLLLTLMTSVYPMMHFSLENVLADVGADDNLAVMTRIFDLSTGVYQPWVSKTFTVNSLMSRYISVKDTTQSLTFEYKLCTQTRCGTVQSGLRRRASSELTAASDTKYAFFDLANMPSEMSIEVWHKPSTYEHNCIFGTGTSGTTHLAQVTTYNAEYFRSLVQNLAANCYVDFSVYPLNEYHHVVSTLSSTYYQLFYDGAVICSKVVDAPIKDQLTRFFLAGYGDPSTLDIVSNSVWMTKAGSSFNFFRGVNRVLTADEVAELYAAPQMHLNEEDLFFSYRISEDGVTSSLAQPDMTQNTLTLNQNNVY